MWKSDSGIDVTAAFRGLTTPIRELYDEIHKRGWSVKKVAIKDGEYVATGQSLHGEDIEATGPDDSSAVGNLLYKVMRREHMRRPAKKTGSWDTVFEKQLDEIAQAYAEAPIYDPKSAPAWIELAQDCQRRAETLVTQLKVEYTPDPAPYKTADEMRQDVKEKQHISVTQANANHPIWSVQEVLAFRLVHDVLGHCVAGGDWGWHGENLACAAHFPLLSETAQKALFTEALASTAYNTVYRALGPQKIAFLDDLLEKAQEKENSPGHTPVHPSQSIPPTKIPDVRESAAQTSVDPNQGWESGIDPLPDNAFLWQGDPLDSQGTMDSTANMDTGLAMQPDPMLKQSVANAFRAALLAPRKNQMNGAIHYQHTMGIPADVDDPVAYWDALEQQRNRWNQLRGHAPGSHQPFWPELQQFKRWIQTANPDLDPRRVDRQSKRELMNMIQDEEERVLMDDPQEEMPAEEIEALAYANLQKRLKGLTKPTTDDKTDFGDAHLWATAHQSADRYGPYLVSHLRSLAGVSHHADDLSEAALTDLIHHKGSGHHFRAKALDLGIPGVGPKEVSTAWNLLAPRQSQLGTLDPHVMETLGRNWDEMSPRDYFKYERELAAGRDAAGYGHIPLGAFSSGLRDQKLGGPGFHQDYSALRPQNPTPYDQVDWMSQDVGDQGWANPYWWDSTQEARDQVGQDWDRHIGVRHPQSDIPFQPKMAKTANQESAPYFVHPHTGEEVQGDPGQSLMQHIRLSLGLPDEQAVWNQELEAGKRS